MWIATEAQDEPPPPLSCGDGDPAPGPAAAAPGVVPALADVYRDHAAYVWRVLRRLGVGPADVEDACQEVFLIVHRRLASFEGRSSLRTWLYGIAIRHAADRRRSARRAAGVLAPASATPPEPAIAAAQPDAIARRQAREVLDAILDELDDAKRAVFVLYELEQLPMIEVAAAVGCPLQTAYSRLHAARAGFEAAIKRRRAREGAP